MGKEFFNIGEKQFSEQLHTELVDLNKESLAEDESTSNMEMPFQDLFSQNIRHFLVTNEYGVANPKEKPFELTLTPEHLDLVFKTKTQKTTWHFAFNSRDLTLNGAPAKEGVQKEFINHLHKIARLIKDQQANVFKKEG